MKIILTQHEILMGALAGTLRRISSMGAAYTPSSDLWSIDIEGACAEVAAAKGLNMYWSGSVNTFKLPDLACNIQVRHTIKRNGCLIVRNDDANNEKFVLVVGEAPEFFIVGWLYGGEAKDDKYEYNPNNREPAYFVPQDKLHPISTINEDGIA